MPQAAPSPGMLLLLAPGGPLGFSPPLALAAWHFLFLQDKDSTKLLLES